MVWGLKKKKKKEDEEVFSVRVEEDALDFVETGKTSDGRIRVAIESLDQAAAWQLRLQGRQREIEERLWMARAVGGDPAVAAKGERDLSWIELVDKVESDYIELRCALSNTADAPDVIVDAENQLEALKDRVGIMSYPRAVLGMVQACVHEQDMGFHVIPGSIWDFDEAAVNSDYAKALRELDELWEKKEEVVDG